LKIDVLSESRIYLAAAKAVAPALKIISASNLPALINIAIGGANGHRAE